MALAAIVDAKEQIDFALAGIRPLGPEAAAVHGEIAANRDAVQVVADEVARLLEDCKGDKSAFDESHIKVIAESLGVKPGKAVELMRRLFSPNLT